MTIESFSQVDDTYDYKCPCGEDCESYCVYEHKLETFWNDSNLQDVCFQFDGFGFVSVKYEFYTRYLNMPCYELYRILSALDECITDKEFLSHIGISKYNVSFSHRAYIFNMCRGLEIMSFMPRVKTYFDSMGFELSYFMDTVTVNFFDGRILNFKVDRFANIFELGGCDLGTIMVGKINSTDMYGYLKRYADEPK
jgi:hypothetical protein